MVCHHCHSWLNWLDHWTVQLSEDLRPLDGLWSLPRVAKIIQSGEELSLAHCELKDLSNVCEMLETPGLALTSLDLSANSFGDDEGGGLLGFPCYEGKIDRSWNHQPKKGGDCSIEEWIQLMIVQSKGCGHLSPSRQIGYYYAEIGVQVMFFLYLVFGPSGLWVSSFFRLQTKNSSKLPSIWPHGRPETCKVTSFLQHQGSDGTVVWSCYHDFPWCWASTQQHHMNHL